MSECGVFAVCHRCKRERPINQLMSDDDEEGFPSFIPDTPERRSCLGGCKPVAIQPGKLQQRAFEEAANILKVARIETGDLSEDEERWMTEYMHTIIAGLVSNHLIRGSPKRK